MASRRKNPTTKRYNRLFHALQTARNGNCPKHHVRMVGKSVITCPNQGCDVEAVREGNGYRMTNGYSNLVNATK